MKPDRAAGLMALGFLVLLLASEAALTLPDADASDAAVAGFYVDHRLVVIALQLAGFAAAVLLGAFVVRLAPISRTVAVTGALVAVLAFLPGLATIVTAVVARRSDPGPAGHWNDLEARADTVLFAGILLFAAVVLVRLGQTRLGLGTIALLTVATTLARLVVELTTGELGALEPMAPLCFIVLVGWLGVLALTGRWGAGRRARSGPAQPQPPPESRTAPPPW